MSDNPIFISYKRADKEKVLEIKSFIEDQLGKSCWIDIDGIESDAIFANVIISAINSCNIFLFMYSKAHSSIEDFENDWTIRELNFAQKKRKIIVFVNIDGTPLTDWFELFFGTKQQIDSNSIENMTKLVKDIKKWLGIPSATELDVPVDNTRHNNHNNSKKLNIEQKDLLKDAFVYAKINGKKVHLIGICSKSTKESNIDNLKKLLDISNYYGLRNQTMLHCITDGRYSPPEDGAEIIEHLQACCGSNYADIASVIGRFYAINIENCWNRISQAYGLMVEGKGKPVSDIVNAIYKSYNEDGIKDEFIKPIHNISVKGCIEKDDVVIFFNSKNNCNRDLITVLSQKEMTDYNMSTIPGLHIYSMDPLDAKFKGVSIISEADINKYIFDFTLVVDESRKIFRKEITLHYY